MSTTVKIRAARPEDVRSLAPKLRESDKREVLASAGATPYRALKDSLKASQQAWTVMMDDKPEAMFGVGAHPQDPSFGVVWMLSSDKPMQNPFQVMRLTPKYIDEMLRTYTRVGNLVDARNTRSIRWLERLGFVHVATEGKWGKAQIPFHFYLKEQQSHV